MVIILTNENIDFLHHEYPRLIYNKGKNTIEGVLSFDLKYQATGVIIQDSYNILIDLNDGLEDGLPKVFETANRILNIALSKKRKPIDLHLNGLNGEMCIIIPPKVKERYPNGFDLPEFLKHIQEHLYWISFYEKYNKEPWKSSGHGDLGYLELFLENKILYGKEVKEYFGNLSRPLFRRKINALKKKYKR